MEETIQTLFENVTWREKLNDANNVMEPVINLINAAVANNAVLGYALQTFDQIATDYIDDHYPEMKGRYQVRVFVFPVKIPDPELYTES